MGGNRLTKLKPLDESGERQNQTIMKSLNPSLSSQESDQRILELVSQSKQTGTDGNAIWSHPEIGEFQCFFCNFSHRMLFSKYERSPAAAPTAPTNPNETQLTK